jgi:hypothetical protein
VRDEAVPAQVPAIPPALLRLAAAADTPADVVDAGPKPESPAPGATRWGG